ncbi:MAG: hypothetical protein FWD85_08840 [Microbacteriaceae bacterium]|nr:hypothetical protein [Microbacteriaceae bacterium]MCL2795396.1 hypothetical protein [Microbacteriaceae bacterium]
MSRPTARPRAALAWGIGAAVAAAALVALGVTGRFHASVLPTAAPAPTVDAVSCFDTSGDPISGWLLDGAAVATSPRIDPLAVCRALIVDQNATAVMDRIATTQRALGHDCVDFDDSAGGHWTLTGIVLSQYGTYAASGGPAPGRLPTFGVIEQPAPLATLPPLPTPLGPCTQLPTVAWDLTTPPLAACTADDTEVSIYERPAGQDSRATCAAHRLITANP